MIISLLSKTLFRASFRKFSETMLKIQQDPLINSKKEMANQFFYSLNENEQQNFQSILEFVQQKPKTGIASKSLTNFLISKYFPGQTNLSNDFEELVNKIGSRESNQKSLLNEVELKQVVQFLEWVKKQEGKGSLKNKISGINDMTQRMSLLEQKFFLRIISKKLRIGLTSKSFYKAKDESKKQTKETPKKQIHSQTNRFQLMVCKPLLKIKQFDQFCAKKGDQKLIIDTKYDGERTLITFNRQTGLVMRSRNGKIQNQMYAPLHKKIYQELQKIQGLQNIQFDGQIVCTTLEGQPLPMQTLLTKRGKQNWSQSENKVSIYVFDVLQYNGKSLIEDKLSYRRSLIPQTKTLKISQSKQIKYPEERELLLSHFNELINKKYEGVIIKGENDIYCTNGSRKHWAKMKKGCKSQDNTSGTIDVDLIVMGADYGQGKRNQFLSTYLTGTYHNGRVVPVCRIGSGFTDEQLKQFTQMFNKQIVSSKPDLYDIPKNIRIQHYFEPKHVFKVHCQDLTRSPLYMLDYTENYGGISLRFPVFQQLRYDKAPQSCTSEELIGQI